MFLLLLACRGWEFLRMDGNTGAAERGELVKRFNDPSELHTEVADAAHGCQL